MPNNTKKIKVMVVDDQADILRSAEILFKGEGTDCVTCNSPADALAELLKHDFDLILLDLNYQTDTTSGQEGIQLINDIRAKTEQVPIVVMTAWASVDIAVDAMKQGANDFITKPWDVERLLNIIQTQVTLSKALLRQEKLENENRILRSDKQSEFVFESPLMKNILHTFNQISASDANVFISGENGTGKSKLASLCHQLSVRAEGPFISVNMGALAESVFESEIFGHQKGAFTGADVQRIGRYELADGGTLFLDEIANISEKQQAALLRLLESGEFERVGSSKTRKADVRIICATNADLQERVAQGVFRQDLYYRINTVPIYIPALRERSEDISILAEYFLNKHKEKYQRLAMILSECAYRSLNDYRWPGNVRELDHCIERAVLLCPDTHIMSHHLGLSASQQSDFLPSLLGPHSVSNIDLTLAEMESQMLEAALIKYMKQPEHAAKALGISRSAFYRKLAKHGFELS